MLNGIFFEQAIPVRFRIDWCIRRFTNHTQPAETSTTINP